MSAKIIESHVRVNEEVNAYNDAPPSDEHVLDVMTRSAMVIQRFWRTRCKQAEHGNEDSAPSPSISRKPTRSFGANASHNNATGSGALSVESFDPTLRTSANLSEQDLHARLISQYEDLLDHREELLRRNLTIQHKLHQARSFEGSQNVSTATGGGGMSHVIFSSKNNEMIDSETDAKYWNSVRRLHILGEEYVNKENAQEVEVGLAREKQQATVESAQTVERDFLQLVVEVAKKATFSRNQNKAIPPAVIQDFVTQEEQRSQRLREARIQYIRTRNLNKRLMEEIKDKDKVSSTLHLIDFEQLKIENTTLNEKIEERNEDLLKLRKKSTTTIHILTHVKEKLECVRGENQKLQQELSDLEVQLSERREELSQIKRKRDAFVLENTRMKEKMPMVGADDLLLDFELRKKDIEDRRMEVFHLTNQHKQFSRKIREAENHLNALSFSPVYYAATTAPFVHTYANRNSSGSLKSSSSLSWKPKVPQKGLTSTQARKSSVPGASKLPEDGRDPDPHSGSAISELGVAVRGQASSPSNQRATGSNRSGKH